MENKTVFKFFVTEQEADIIYAELEQEFGKGFFDKEVSGGPQGMKFLDSDEEVWLVEFGVEKEKEQEICRLAEDIVRGGVGIAIME